MSSNVVLKGSIGFIGLGDLLQQLGGSGSTGVIRLTSPHAETQGLIYLKNGNPIQAKSGSSEGLEALNSFFGWTDADFEFLSENITCEQVIRKSRMEIILDGLRMVDDGLIPKVGSKTAPVLSAGDSGIISDLPVIRGPLIDYVYIVDEEEFSAGTDVVVQNRFGNWFWVILSGNIEVIRILPEGAAPIVRLTDGAYIGSIVSFLRQGNVRSATLKAMDDVQLGVLDSQLISREYSNLSGELQNILVSIDKRLKQVTDVCARAVLKNDIFTNLHKSSDLVISSDKQESTCFRITGGEAFVVRQTSKGNVHLCTMASGDIIGQMPFLNTSHEPYSADVYVSKNFKADVYDLTAVREEYDRLSQTFKNMLQNISTSISVTTGRILDLVKKN